MSWCTGMVLNLKYMCTTGYIIKCLQRTNQKTVARAATIFIIGHCNYDGIKKLPNLVEVMKTKEKIGALNQDCETCIQGKFSQSRNKQPDRRATFIFELLHTDLTGPIDLVDINGHIYAITFTDDISSAVFV